VNVEGGLQEDTLTRVCKLGEQGKINSVMKLVQSELEKLHEVDESKLDGLSDGLMFKLTTRPMDDIESMLSVRHPFVEVPEGTQGIEEKVTGLNIVHSYRNLIKYETQGKQLETKMFSLEVKAAGKCVTGEAVL
jgi:hypothetical protein